MPYSPTNWVNGETQFNEDNMNKIEQAMGNRQLDTFTTLAQIGLTDNDFSDLTEVGCADLLRESMPLQSTLFIQCLNNSNQILRAQFAPNSTSGYMIVKKYSNSYVYFEYQALQATTGDDTIPSNRGNKSWISMYNNDNSGNNRFSNWRQSGGITIIQTTVTPGNSVTWQAVTTASAAVIHFRTTDDSSLNRGSVVATRGRSANQISNIFGTQNYIGIVGVNFNTGEVTSSNTTSDGIIIDRIDLI